MRFFTKNKILIFLIVILFVSNLTTIIALVIHKREFHRLPNDTQTINSPVANTGSLFRDKLNLSIEQNDIFRNLRRNYNRSARTLSYEMQYERVKMINELSKSNPDTMALNAIANDIGTMHSQLKRLTFKYFLDMKKECNKEQKEKLTEIFEDLLNSDGNVSLPAQGRGNRHNRNFPKQ